MLSRFFNSSLFDGLNKIVDVFLLGLYFIVCSIPIFTIGASFTALYYSVHKVIYQGRGYTTEFFHSFKDNFKQATLSWLIFLAAGGILVGDIYITRVVIDSSEKISNMWVVFTIMLIFMIIWALYHFTYMARFENGFKATFKISGAIAVLHFAYSIIIALITAVFALFSYLLPVLFIFVPALYVVCVHPIFEKIYRQYMTDEDKAMEDSYK